MDVNKMRNVIIDEQIVDVDDEEGMDKLELSMNAFSSPSKRSSPEKATRSKRTEEEIKEHSLMLNYECEETA